MNILILEDEDAKFDVIKAHIAQLVSSAEIRREKNWLDYTRAINSSKFDLILLDLLVPKSSRDDTIEDHMHSLVSTTRDYGSKSFLTPAIVLTRQALDTGDSLHDLNKVDITAITFNDHGEWKDALEIKLLAAQPKKKFEFVVVCALEKEAEAFEKFTDVWGPAKTISGLICREVTIGAYRGAIVRAPRMGLVAAAVVASLALERFEPRLICMSGICGGIPKESKIYDLLISQGCHQHDAGKWSDLGFRCEHYDVQIDVNVHNKLVELSAEKNIERWLTEGLDPGTSEVPKGYERVTCNINPYSSTSSGSAVIAQNKQTASLNVGQRKLAGFDMEVYSIYEAARHAIHKPAFFAAKCVVDDGDANKGDKFHRIGCAISAKFVAHAIRAGIADINKSE